MELIAADARRPFGFCQGRGLLAGRQAGRVRIRRPYRQALGLGHGGFAADARGPFGFCQRRGLLAGRQAGRVRIR